ncbi:MAG: hypothetical protein ACLTS6_11455 [Anaerobutyricum sp.]
MIPQTSALVMLVETDYDTAIKRAEQMRDLNVERQNLTKEGMEEAFKIIDAEMQDDKVLVVYLPEAHESIAGNHRRQNKRAVLQACFRSYKR